MRRALLRWIMAPAPWWAFWMPSSGLLGGVFMGLIICGSVELARRWT